MKILTVRHVTTYRYKQPVSFGEHRMMLRPRDSYDQRLIEARLEIDPEPAALNWMHDVVRQLRGDRALLAAAPPSSRFDSTIRLDHEPNNALEFELEDYALDYPFSYSSEEIPDLLRSIERQYLDRDRDVDRWAHQFLRKQGPTGTRELLAAMTHAIHERFTYVVARRGRDAGPGGDAAARQRQLPRFRAADDGGGALARPRGAVRLGLSGAVRPRRPRRGSAANRPMPGCEVYLPGAGWIEYDPTNGLIGNERSDPRRGGARPAPGGADLRHLDRLPVRFHRHDRRCRGHSRGRRAQRSRPRSRLAQARENFPEPPDRRERPLHRQPWPLAAHDEVVDAQRLAIARDLLRHRGLVADDEPVAREVLER